MSSRPTASITRSISRISPMPTDFAFDDRAGCLDLVVNATPLGMARPAARSPSTGATPRPAAIVYDIVTASARNRLASQARAQRACARSTGSSMLIGQAAMAFEHFFGAAPPRETAMPNCAGC